jgi:DNA-binding transcriptional LysR family regulator
MSIIHKNADLALLRTLVLIVEGGSFGVAATQCNRTQSAVSQQMQRLEKDLGVVLFEVRGRTKVITNGGYWIYQQAKKLLEINDQMYSDLDDITTLVPEITVAKAHSVIFD